MGIEPTLSAWEAEVLPLNYTRLAHARYFMLFAPEGKIKYHNPLPALENTGQASSPIRRLR
jgi:hypothetical protein